jgi:D-serine deaminase-like pyridoxal phosphate-dependent protein
MEEIAKSDLSQIEHFLKMLEEHLLRMSSEKGADNATSLLLQNLSISVGSTPSVFQHENPNEWPTMEIHAGNYTLYDRQQLFTKACASEDDIAGRVMTRVIGHYEDRNTILLDAGATALTKELTPQGGMAAIGGGSGLSKAAAAVVAQSVEVYKMSQEVSLVRPVDPKATFPYKEFPLGSMVNLLPNHSCLAAACFDKYYIIDDPSCSFSPDEPVVDEWIPVKGFHVP